MSEEARLGEWQIEFKSDGSEPTIRTLDGTPIATVHGTKDQLLRRAVLIAKAPSLRDAVQAAIAVFQAMAEHEHGKPAGLAALDILPVLESALYGLDTGAS